MSKDFSHTSADHPLKVYCRLCSSRFSQSSLAQPESGFIGIRVRMEGITAESLNRTAQDTLHDVA